MTIEELKKIVNSIPAEHLKQLKSAIEKESTGNEQNPIVGRLLLREMKAAREHLKTQKKASNEEPPNSVGSSQ